MVLWMFLTRVPPLSVAFSVSAVAHRIERVVDAIALLVGDRDQAVGGVIGVGDTGPIRQRHRLQ